MWIWGKLTMWLFKWHIARELRPFATRHGVSREDTIEVTCMKMRKHFDAVWPG